MLVRGTEVDIIIEDGSSLVSIFQESLHLRTNDRVQCIVRSEHYQIVSLYARIGKVKSILGMILIEDIFSIILVVEES